MVSSHIPLWSFRLATPEDTPNLQVLIASSVRQLSRADYTDEQMDGAIGTALGLDTQLILDQTYFVVECPEATTPGAVIGCGEWSARKTLCCGDNAAGRDDTLLDPACDAAKIRAIYVHPSYARRGLGTAILHFVEIEAMRAGFRRLEMGATVTGAPLYEREGYREVERTQIPLHNGATLPVIRMSKQVANSHLSASSTRQCQGLASSV
jgi:GNAT superfamily N-acetyltransferase